MRRLVVMFVVLAAAVAVICPATAQQKRISPHETISAVIGGNRVTITYGRPYSKDPKGATIRKIWGGLVPWGQAWRTGADEATTLITQQPIMLGDAMLPAGAYTLYTVPMETGASKLAISNKIGQWGIPVNEKDDLARVDMKKDPIDQQVDQLTLAIEKAGTGGVIKITWEKTQFSVPFSTVKK
jgi:hypothetical protein